jgi:hypothetical protein
MNIDNVKSGVSKEEVMRLLRAAGMLQDSTPVKLQQMRAVRVSRPEPRPEHEELGMSHSEWFRRYVSDW